MENNLYTDLQGVGYAFAGFYTDFLRWVHENAKHNNVVIGLRDGEPMKHTAEKICGAQPDGEYADWLRNLKTAYTTRALLEKLNLPGNIVSLPQTYFKNLGMVGGKDWTFVDTGLYGSHVDYFKKQNGDKDIQVLLACADNAHAAEPIQHFAGDKNLERHVKGDNNILMTRGFLYTLTSVIENIPKQYKSAKSFSMQDGQILPKLEPTSPEERECYRNFYIGLDKGIENIMKAKTEKMPDAYYENLFRAIEPIKELLDMSETEGQPAYIRENYSANHSQAIRGLVSKITALYGKERAADSTLG